MYGVILVMKKKKMETATVYWGHIGILERKLEPTIVYWGYIGITEKKWKLLQYIGAILPSESTSSSTP